MIIIICLLFFSVFSQCAKHINPGGLSNVAGVADIRSGWCSRATMSSTKDDPGVSVQWEVSTIY